MQPATSHPVIDKPCTDRLRENRSRRRRISRATAGRVARLLERYENGEQTGFLPLIPTSSIARNLDCPGIDDTHQPHSEAFSKASGLMPPRWLWRRVRL